MTAREQIHAHTAQLEQCQRCSAVLRGFAILTGGASVATLAPITIARLKSQFSQFPHAHVVVAPERGVANAFRLRMPHGHKPVPDSSPGR
jgi:hypothetical protein